MATCGTIAASTTANLIHRAAGVALKEDRRLVIVPRETPLSVIHLRALLTLREAGALIAPAMPGFYAHPIRCTMRSTSWPERCSISWAWTVGF